MTDRIVITGAAGAIGTALRSRLRRAGRTLVLVDVRAPEPSAAADEVVVVGDLRDATVLDEALHGADLVAHLGGLSTERPWDDILAVNVDGAHTLLEGVVRAGVPRVLMASSVHAEGFAARDATTLGVRPDSLYGVGKVAAEALASVYADQHGLVVVSARLANVAPVPTSERALSLWCSLDDVARLVEAVAVLDRVGHHLVWGVSANTRGVLDLAPGRAIGFEPLDDAETFAAEALAADARRRDDGAPIDRLDVLGAGFVARALGG